MSTRRCVLAITSVAVLTVLCTASCSAAPPSQTKKMTGTLTLRGAQIEAFWGIRDDDGKLWRVQPSSTLIKDQFKAWNNQRVEVQGTVLIDGATQNGLPTLDVTEARQVASQVN